MKIIVCIRQGLDGEISPFDASAYEAALRIENAEVTLLSMAAPSSKDFLERLSRLGASRAVLLSDKAFAGADTLATAYALSCALKHLSPDLVLCGRQTLIGDTGQTGAMLSEMAGLSLATNVMGIESVSDHGISCLTRTEGTVTCALPALLCVERIHVLRLPRLRSKSCEVEILGAADVGADVSRCGLAGSPTRVVQSFENKSGKRNCQFISPNELSAVTLEALKKTAKKADAPSESKERLASVCIVGEAPRAFAASVSDDITVIPLTDAETVAAEIQRLAPSAVLWGSDPLSKRLAALVAAKLSLGLCADCTALGCENGTLMMYRPALSGSVIAKIKSLTRPAMATVRTESDTENDVIVAAGYGVKDSLDRVKAFADSLGARLCASRRLVDNGYARYDMQVGLTGSTVSPPLYIAVGISGAVHHVVGMQRSGTVIAINPDKSAPIFEYADFGIVADFEEIF
ncbi:MAG: FAD-binding protein [Clostridia bacterium]|nr:FAD-binding protein [Clostridia bacterium]